MQVRRCEDAEGTNRNDDNEPTSATLPLFLTGIGTKISEAYENVTGAFVNITWEDFHIESPRDSGMYIDVYEEDTICSQPSQHKPADWLTAHNLTYRNIYGEGELFGGRRSGAARVLAGYRCWSRSANPSCPLFCTCS